MKISSHCLHGADQIPRDQNDVNVVKPNLVGDVMIDVLTKLNPFRRIIDYVRAGVPGQVNCRPLIGILKPFCLNFSFIFF